MSASSREASISTPRGGRDAEGQRTLRAFLAGEPAAVRQVERWAWEIVYFRWGSIPPEEREDVVQDAVAGVWRAVTRPGFRLRTHLRALVRRVAAARCIDRMRRRRPTATLDPALADPAPGPYDRVLRDDERARLRWAVQSLDERCRELIREHFFEDVDYTQMAERRQRAESTIRVHMFNCMKAIRRLWERWA
jgi:RNA polymerase sigma-70 factor (ECF subfamily)